MRTRRLWPWLIFAVGALLVLEGLGWVTWRALTLERRERDAAAQSKFQESIRLALWRMDSELTPLLAQEVARPYFHYRAFYPAQRPYDRMWDPLSPADPLAPSPLLDLPGPFVRLHFELAAGALTSPQAPPEDQLAHAPTAALEPELLMLARRRLAELRDLLATDTLAATSAKLEAAATPPPRAEDPQPAATDKPADPSEREYLARQEIAQNVYQRAATAPRARRSAQLSEPAAPTASPAAELAAAPAFTDAAATTAADATTATESRRADPASSIAEPARGLTRAAPLADASPQPGPFEPRWLTAPDGSPHLIVTRQVTAADTTITQGFWVDWPAVRERLLASSRTLLPGADLAPLTPRSPGASGAPAQRLASLPAVLLPGPVPPAPPAALTATHAVLALTWLATVSAISAIGFVLHKSMDLSDRRGRFVSAVTHELRTPLTTFTLYTELLESGLVQDDAARRDYLRTLRDESRRLTGIVENVLAYARLGRRPARAADPIPAADLLAAVEPALRRAADAGHLTLELNANLPPTAHVRADPALVERILINLVENAAKYAAGAADRRLHLAARLQGPPRKPRLALSVRDHGPGVPPAEHRRIFDPFHRAPRDERSAIPGLGLGLALAKGLAQDLGGDLTLTASSPAGAEFTLDLPLC